MACIGRCGIYSTRPQFCQDYPRVQDFIPPGCTYSFIGSERTGSCQPNVCQENICCAYPREGGEPEGVSLDEFAGGEPCKHLKWEEVPATKTASEDEGMSVTEELLNLTNNALTRW